MGYKKKMTDIMLINSPISFVKLNLMLGDETWCPPLGLLYIAAVLEKKGYSVRVVDARVQRFTLERIVDVIRKEEPGRYFGPYIWYTRGRPMR
jgi:hypothetical protein